MDKGDMKSRDLGKMKPANSSKMGKDALTEQQGQIPDTLENQNTEHNAKKEQLGPNTKR